MPRRARLDAPGTLHHVMVRGIERGKNVTDDADRDNFVSRLGDLAASTQTTIYSWALMSNHAHILLRSSTFDLSGFMRRFMTGYAIFYNRRHRRWGAFLMKGLIVFIIPLIISCSNISIQNDLGKKRDNLTEILIIEVTDKDISKYGRFPWGRDIHGKALKILSSYKAKGVYFDMVFSEQDSRWPEKDSAFSIAIQESKIPVFIPYFFVKEGGKKVFPYHVGGVKVDDASHIKKMKSQVLPSLSQFVLNATNTGYINVFLNKNNILKDITTMLQWNGKYYPFIGVTIAAHYFNTPIEEVYLENRILHIGKVKIKLRTGAKIRPYFGKPFKKYKHYAYSDLLEGKLANKIQGRFIIMGYNATGLSDFLVTTSSNRFPGSEVHAVFIDYVLNEIGTAYF